MNTLISTPLIDANGSSSPTTDALLAHVNAYHFTDYNALSDVPDGQLADALDTFPGAL